MDVLLPRQTGLWSPAVLPDSLGQAPCPRMLCCWPELAGTQPGAPAPCRAPAGTALPAALLVYLKETVSVMLAILPVSCYSRALELCVSLYFSNGWLGEDKRIVFHGKWNSGATKSVLLEHSPFVCVLPPAPTVELNHCDTDHLTHRAKNHHYWTLDGRVCRPCPGQIVKFPKTTTQAEKNTCHPAAQS